MVLKVCDRGAGGKGAQVPDPQRAVVAAAGLCVWGGGVKSDGRDMRA